MDDLNYFTVFGWMKNALGLKGVDLYAFALIYSITQNGNTVGFITPKYLEDCLNISNPTAYAAIKNLEEKNLIVFDQEIGCYGYQKKKDRVHVNINTINSLVFGNCPEKLKADRKSIRENI